MDEKGPLGILPKGPVRERMTKARTGTGRQVTLEIFSRHHEPREPELTVDEANQIADLVYNFGDEHGVDLVRHGGDVKIERNDVLVPIYPQTISTLSQLKDYLESEINKKLQIRVLEG